MDANTWGVIAFVALMVLCCLPMFFMSRRRERADAESKKESGKPKP